MAPPGDNLYPGFMDSIAPSFTRLYETFKSFLTADLMLPEPNVDECELTYIDIIETGEFWRGLEDTSKVIPFFSELSIDVEGAKRFGFNYAQGYYVDSDMQLDIDINSGVSQSDPERRALRLEFKATGKVVDDLRYEADGWWKRAHDLIVQCFVGITSKDVQYGPWGRRA